MRQIKKRGSLTIEAALVMPLFIFAVFGIFTFFGCLKIYDKVQVTISDNIRIFAKSSFLLSDTDIDKLMTDLQNNDLAVDQQRLVRNIADVVNITEFSDNTFANKIDKLQSGGAIDVSKYALKDKLKTIGKSDFTAYMGFAIINEIMGGSLASDMESTIQGKLTDYLKNTTEVLLEKEFGENLEEAGLVRLKSGEFFNMEETNFQLGITDEIQIVVSYRIKLPSVFGKKKSMPIKQRVAIKPWGGM